MLKEYLIVAQEALNAKKEIYQIKQQRFELAQEEYQHLHKMCEDDNRSYASCEFVLLLIHFSHYLAFTNLFKNLSPLLYFLVM